MTEPVIAVYQQVNDDWSVTVTGFGKELTAKSPGIIAARDRADQLVEKLLKGDVKHGKTDTKVTVVHLLDGSALKFTTMYMTARLARPATPPLEIPESAPAKTAQPAKTSKANKAKASTKRTGAPNLSNGKMANIAEALDEKGSAKTATSSNTRNRTKPATKASTPSAASA